MTRLFPLFAELRAVFSDNPILAKDALLAGRRSSTLVVAILTLGALGLGVAIALLIAVAESDHFYGSMDLVGQPLLIGLTICILGLQGMLLPVLASTSIASERERGTLDLLTTSALSPGRIVAGKLGALLSTYVPVLLLCVPFLSLSMLAGEVSVVDVLGAVLLIGFNGFVLLSSGLLASSSASNTRTSAFFTFVFSFVVLWPILVGPSIALVALRLEPNFTTLAPLYALLALAGATIAAHSIIGARGQVAPRRIVQRVYRWRVTRAALVGIPVVAAAMPWFLVDRVARDTEAWRHLIGLPLATLLIFLVVLEVALSGTRSSDEVSAGRAAFLTSRQAFLGLLLATPILIGALPGDFLTSAGVGVGALVGGGLFLAVCAAFTAVLSRTTPNPLVRVVLAFAAISALLLAPVASFVLYEVIWPGPDFVPLAFTNPLVIAGSAGEIFGGEWVRFFDLKLRHTEIMQMPPYIVGPVFYALVLAVLTPLVRRRR